MSARRLRIARSLATNRNRLAPRGVATAARGTTLMKPERTTSSNPGDEASPGTPGTGRSLPRMPGHRPYPRCSMRELRRNGQDRPRDRRRLITTCPGPGRTPTVAQWDRPGGPRWLLHSTRPTPRSCHATRGSPASCAPPAGKSRRRSTLRLSACRWTWGRLTVQARVTAPPVSARHRA